LFCFKKEVEFFNDQETKKSRKYTFLDRIIHEAKEEGLEVIPINCTLKKCTIEEKRIICNEYKRSKVFQRNLMLLEEAISAGQSVTFGGRDLYIVDSPEHELLKMKKLMCVKKFRMNQKTQNEQLRNLEKRKNLISDNSLTSFPLKLPTILIQTKSKETPLKLPTQLIQTKIKKEANE
jgi:hypothetical protein